MGELLGEVPNPGWWGEAPEGFRWGPVTNALCPSRMAAESNGLIACSSVSPVPAADELNRSGSSYGESRGRLNSIISGKISADVRLSRMPSVAAGVPIETPPDRAQGTDVSC